MERQTNTVIHLTLYCNQHWKAECEQPFQFSDHDLRHSTTRISGPLMWEVDYDRMCGYDNASIDDTSSALSIDQETGSQLGPSNNPGDFCDHANFFGGSDVHITQHNQHESTNDHDSDKRVFDGEDDEEYDYDELDFNNDDDDDSLFDPDEVLETDSDDEFHPGWTTVMSPSLNPTKHSTPPEVMKWAAWPTIYDSLESALRHSNEAMRKAACIRSALKHVDVARGVFVDLSRYKFPYAARGKLRPLPHLPDKRMRRFRAGR
ncbi:hypothetical protein HDK77DRAFT_485704 [Phyllosticta capitalensis]